MSSRIYLVLTRYVIRCSRACTRKTGKAMGPDGPG